MPDDLFTAAQNQQERQRTSNVPEMSVADLALSLKRTLEETFGRVRVRGELSGIKLASSGHLYGDIKDEQAVINIICWRGTMSQLSVRPEDGLDVIVTGRVSSYPKSSRYQIIIDSMELAGEGALLKMLEDRKRKLAAEGLFSADRKQPLPFLPEVIGVITSPTGAVIRDILHRLHDRFPRHVLLWPVAVQGENAAEQITGAIRGFNALPENGTIPRPDILIVARGGGSLEDLMAFNEENVVRAVAESRIPVISAVGHETDTTLIDYAADLRAPTPTGAAEMAVPVRINLIAQVQDDTQRLTAAALRLIQRHQSTLETQGARLGDPRRLLENKAQTLDYLSGRLKSGFENGLHKRQNALTRSAASLRSPQYVIQEKSRTLALHTQALQRTGGTLTNNVHKRLDHAVRMLESLSFERVLDRGYAVVRDETGRLISRAAATSENMKVEIQFSGKEKVGAIIGKPLKT